MPGYRSRSILAGFILLAAAPAGAAVPADLPVFESRDLARAAATAPLGGHLRLENVLVADTGAPAAFVLERFQVFAADAEITVHGSGGTRVLPAPANTYFRGVVDGQPDSRVFLAVLENGTAQGMVNEAEETYLIGGEGLETKTLGLAPLEMHRVSPTALKSAPNAGFTCGNDHLPPGRSSLEGSDFATALEADTVPQAAAAHTARVAIESDYEFYQKFNDATVATNYIGNLIGYASTVYVAEVSTSLVVQSVSLWTTSNDPWAQTSTTCGLMEFGRYWNLNKTGVSRTIAHFMSGKANGGGIAWLRALCSSAFNISTSCPGLPTDAPWGGGYGYTGNLSGTFNISNPTVVWDILAVSHEIGHNFGSPHTHCYNGIGGNANPVDGCYSGECANGCYCGTQTLPGAAGAHTGTIMSYCHLLGGGYSNIALTFGTNHPYGVLPGRVPDQMKSHIQSVASFNPSCLAPAALPNAVFSDSFESGVMTSWQ